MSLPIYAHPALTVLIDGGAAFLGRLARQLDPGLASKTFHDSAQALCWLRDEHAAREAAAGTDAGALAAHVDTHAAAPERRHAAIDVRQIHRVSHDARRFLTPAVLVVDQAMPPMDGLAFCRAVRHLPCKKILFGEGADERIAVDAFNQGLIDRFIRKGDGDALERLEHEILALRQAYFAERAAAQRALLLLHDYRFLDDPAFAAVVRELSARHDFVEHYVFAAPGGILFFDSHGRAQLMAVETEAGLRAHFEVARDNGAPPSLLEALAERRVMPFFSGGDGMYTPAHAHAWHRHCKAPQVCAGRDTYYWALFQLPAACLPVLSYRQFLRQHDSARLPA